MSRHSTGSSYSHTIRKLCSEEYEISWVVDFYYKDSRLRFPRRMGRVTDEAGARRFCKKWSLSWPIPAR